MILIVRGLIVVSVGLLPEAEVMRNSTSSKILEQFGDAVRERRRQMGLSQEELADRAGLDRTYLGGVERGERNVSLINIHAIAAALGDSVEVLFIRTSCPEPVTPSVKDNPRTSA